jgi:broad specificity phosphatase PhoE
MTMSTDTIRPEPVPSKAPDDAPASSNPDSAVRPGAVIMARHGEPDISRRIKLSAAEYAAWWARYEETGLRQGQTPPPELLVAVERAASVLSSTRIRAIETAYAVSGGRVFEIDETLIEAPLPPPHWPDWLRFSPRTWGVIARLWWWFFNHHLGQETRAQAEVRAESVAARLEALALAGGDVVVLAHGFFNTMIGQRLKRRGWKLVENQGFNYWCARRFERR